MTGLFDVAAIGNAIVDVIAPADDSFLTLEGMAKGAMTLIDEARAEQLYGRMAAGIEASGGSAANTCAVAASLGGERQLATEDEMSAFIDWVLSHGAHGDVRLESTSGRVDIAHRYKARA